MTSVIAFDLFGTVFSLYNAPQDEVEAYLNHIKQHPWKPLTLPDSWNTLPAHEDAVWINRLRKKFTVVTCSNAPLGTQIRMCKSAGLWFDGHIPLELNKVFKPQALAYLTVCEVLGCDAKEVMMVTANKRFGDLEASAILGMRPMLIRHKDAEVAGIYELAQLLGC